MINSRHLFPLSALSLAVIITTGCSLNSETDNPDDPAYSHADSLPVYSQASFEQYQAETADWLRENRIFMTEDRETELSKVLPAQYTPDHPNGQGVLLVHGLGDTPYSYIDIAHHLATKGYLVRTVLLPGHASKSGDLILPSYDDWQGVVHHHINLLKQDVDSVWLGGYSTGANLVTTEALNDSEISGLLLFSPAFEPSMPAVKWAKLASYFIDWADQDPEDNPLRYNSLPMNGAAVYYQTSEEVQKALNGQFYDKPVFMMMSEADSVISTDYAHQTFNQQFTNPANRLIWQGEKPLADPRSSQLSMDLPEQRISNGSHMGLMFSPHNPDYGIDGNNLICSNGQGEVLEKACIEGAEVWFSAWGYTEEGKNHARLTYNPYFELSISALDEVMSSVNIATAK
ncbi:alpha/beta fold hydrolase [Vibrio maerlii]|uniref:alpha/beta fold hydrolase n=1 Tax=Vibrio maerlii TaxID=2231648 RepID=UPI000E3B7440|nr:alpha/beta fold hydrolase [Vibrio maerlii]